MAKLKGHAVIELTDVKTGKKERVEHDNIITNALADIISGTAKYSTRSYVNQIFMPLYQKGVCGLYLFDNTLQENANNFMLPSIGVAKLTGYAGNVTSDGNDTKRGDFNANESGEITNGYKFVWDFGTDDANGEIAALSLTHQIAGYHGYYYEQSGIMSKGTSGTSNDITGNYKGLGISYSYFSPDEIPNSLFWRIVEFKEDENKFITIEKTSATNIDIKTYEYAFNNIGLETTGLFSYRLINTESITIADTGDVTAVTSTMSFVSGDDDYYYGAGSGSNQRTFICKIHKTTHAYSYVGYYDVIRNAWHDMGMLPISNANNSSGFNVTQFAVRNGYIYSATDDAATATVKYGVAKRPLNNLSEVTYIADTTRNVVGQSNNPANGRYFCLLKNGDIWANGCLIDSNDNVVNTSGAATNYGLNYNPWSTSNRAMAKLLETKDFYIFAQEALRNYATILPKFNYLATLNNLDAPVTKTAAKTMKITYTLTLAE